MRGRHLTTGITLLVLVGVLVLGAVVGAKSLLAPVPGNAGAAASATPPCTTAPVRKGQRITARQVEVSVFNGGTRVGLAGVILDDLGSRGFKKGDAGNAPAGTRIKKVQVWTTLRNDPAARLVARQFGHATRVRVVRTSLGPGIDVVVGDAYRALAKAKRSIIVKRTSAVCVPVPSAGASG